MHLLVACLLAVVIICVLFSFFENFQAAAKIGAPRYLYFLNFLILLLLCGKVAAQLCNTYWRHNT